MVVDRDRELEASRCDWIAVFSPASEERLGRIGTSFPTGSWSGKPGFVPSGAEEKRPTPDVPGEPVLGGTGLRTPQGDSARRVGLV